MTPEQLLAQLQSDHLTVVTVKDTAVLKKYTILKAMSIFQSGATKYVTSLCVDHTLEENPAFPSGWEHTISQEWTMTVDETTIYKIVDSEGNQKYTSVEQPVFDQETGEQTGTETVQVPRITNQWDLLKNQLYKPALEPQVIEGILRKKMIITSERQIVEP